MINLFYASFIPGLQNLIAEVIKERLPDAKILKLLDGAVLFETETSYDKLNFFCFNNIFAVINIMEEQKRSDNVLEKHIKTFINGGCNFNEDVIINNSKNFKTFRIVVSNENTPSAIEEKLRLEAERYITKLSGLKVNRSLPDTEFWFLYRTERSKTDNENPLNNFSIFMKRLTLRSSWEKTLHKGELPPPLAWVLCRLANLTHGDTVLDPFCGYGSIPQEAVKHFHVTKFIACDNNKEAALFSEQRFSKRKKGEFTLHGCDFCELLSKIEEKSIDVIVTDPPWGHFGVSEEARNEKGIENNDQRDFLFKMFEVFGKLLKDGGRAAVLYANDDRLLKAAPPCFKLKGKMPVLLSGKKAVIYSFLFTAENTE
ncbi:MAG: methyltransferase domain-containing protein [Treponema sp.]|nr:methyltransferase domain-containing protein [Treponema sp.]MCL2251225.1 methyltransferase domain-containing protein [Treponema sp.]